MPPLRPFEQIDAGGVDSRSNPINFPRNRALRCLNWVPRQAGFWELRWGYSAASMTVQYTSPIHSMFPYRTWNGHKYVLFMQGTHLLSLDTATGATTEPPVHGNLLSTSAKGAGYFAANRFHYGNGTDQSWFDSIMWRNNGIPALTPTQVLNIILTEGTRELTAAENSSVTLTAVAAGSFPGDSGTGRLIYVTIFDKQFGEIGPSTISAGSGRIVVPVGDKVTVANMPNLSNTNLVKLLGGTGDGGNLAYFFTNTSTNITSCTLSGLTLTVVAAAHGLISGNVVIIAGTTNWDNVYSIAVIDANTFTVTLQMPSTLGNTGAVGTAKRIVSASNSATSQDILAPTQDTSYQVNQNRGLAASTIGGPNAGYQFYISIYNPNGGGHVGNRVLIGPRALQTSYRSNWRIFGLPNLSVIDTEWVILIGRTGDGASTPYVVADNALNWAIVPNGQTFILVTQANLDGQHEMPTRNGIIPSQCNMFAVAGDFVYAADPNSPYLRRSGDMSQNTERGNTFTGRAEQSWAPDDVDTFPSGEATTGIFEVDQEIFVGTLHDSALSINLSGIQQWAAGPWPVGIAGRRAGTKCGAMGFYWLSGDKQLCMFSQGVPIGVSDEYELAELSQIGDQFLSTVELVYYRNIAQNKDELRIEAQKADGTPYTIIHDFKLREVYSAPGSLYGQGYASQFQGPLAIAFTTALVRDGNGKLQVFAGASNGQIYQLYTGADDVGSQYTADLILLVNGGRRRFSVPFIDWYGDAQVNVSVGQTLNTSLDPNAAFAFEQLTPPANMAQVVQGSENDFLYRAYLDAPEVQHIYVRFQLASHSSDGNLNLNSPPHIPLESYGRIYELIPALGDERDL